jgi:hypothetical protein
MCLNQIPFQDYFLICSNEIYHLLLERKIKNGDIFIVKNNGLLNNIKKPELLNEEGNFIPTFQEVLRTIFGEFSTDDKVFITFDFIIN